MKRKKRNSITWVKTDLSMISGNYLELERSPVITGMKNVTNGKLFHSTLLKRIQKMFGKHKRITWKQGYCEFEQDMKANTSISVVSN